MRAFVPTRLVVSDIETLDEIETHTSRTNGIEITISLEAEDFSGQFMSDTR